MGYVFKPNINKGLLEIWKHIGMSYHKGGKYFSLGSLKK